MPAATRVTVPCGLAAFARPSNTVTVARQAFASTRDWDFASTDALTKGVLMLRPWKAAEDLHDAFDQVQHWWRVRWYLTHLQRGFLIQAEYEMVGCGAIAARLNWPVRALSPAQQFLDHSQLTAIGCLALRRRLRQRRCAPPGLDIPVHVLPAASGAAAAARPAVGWRGVMTFMGVVVAMEDGL